MRNRNAAVVKDEEFRMVLANASPDKLKLLLIEDEAMVAFFMEDMLMDMGHEVGAIASRMPEALEIARTGAFDLAILDVNLDGKPSYPIAEVLRERSIPFAFATGYGIKGIDPRFADVPVLTKPFLESEMKNVLQQLQKSEAFAARRAPNSSAGLRHGR
jgi:CheY-like chemotaxis protein